MTIGEVWIQNPMFPILVYILATWVLFTTIVFVRIWYRLDKIEQHIKFFETLTTEGIGNIAKKIQNFEKKFNQGKYKPNNRKLSIQSKISAPNHHVISSKSSKKDSKGTKSVHKTEIEGKS